MENNATPTHFAPDLNILLLIFHFRMELFFGYFVSSPFPCAQSTRSAARAAYSHIQSVTSHCPSSVGGGGGGGGGVGESQLCLVAMEINSFNRTRHCAFGEEEKHAKSWCDDKLDPALVV